MRKGFQIILLSAALLGWGGAEQSDGRARPATKRFGGGKTGAKQPSWKPEAPKRSGPRRGGKPVGGRPVGGKGR